MGGSGKQLGRYEIKRRLACGGMAEVWLAVQRGVSGFKKELALKTILPQFAGNTTFAQMFVNEALVAARLNHPNIVQILDLGNADGIDYIAMEYVQGRTLRQILTLTRQGGEQIPVWFSLLVLASVCDGLQYAHDFIDENGQPLEVVHRDVTPENIMVSYGGAVKVVDFGVAKATLAIDTEDDTLIKGKWAYVAPEQYRGVTPDRRSDIYTVGVTMYELLTGERPFHGSSHAELVFNIVGAKFKRPRELVPAMPPALEQITLTAMACDPAQRYAQAALLAAALRQYLLDSGQYCSEKDVGRLTAELFAQDDECAADQLKSPSGSPASRSIPSGSGAWTPAPRPTPRPPPPPGDTMPESSAASQRLAAEVAAAADGGDEDTVLSDADIIMLDAQAPESASLAGPPSAANAPTAGEDLLSEANRLAAQALPPSAKAVGVRPASPAPGGSGAAPVPALGLPAPRAVPGPAERSSGVRERPPVSEKRTATQTPSIESSSQAPSARPVSDAGTATSQARADALKALWEGGAAVSRRPDPAAARAEPPEPTEPPESSESAGETGETREDPKTGGFFDVRRGPTRVGKDIFGTVREEEAAAAAKASRSGSREREAAVSSRGQATEAASAKARAAGHFDTGLAYMTRRQYDLALDEWQEAVRLDPDHRLYQSNLRKLRKLMAAESDGR